MFELAWQLTSSHTNWNTVLFADLFFFFKALLNKSNKLASSQLNLPALYGDFNGKTDSYIFLILFSDVQEFIFSLFSQFPGVVSLYFSCIFTIYRNNPLKCTFNRMERGQHYVTPLLAHCTRLFPLCNWQIHGKQPQTAEVNCVLRTDTMTNYKSESLWPLCIGARLSLVISSRTRSSESSQDEQTIVHANTRFNIFVLSHHVFPLWFI